MICSDLSGVQVTYRFSPPIRNGCARYRPARFADRADLRLVDGGRTLLWPKCGVSIDVEGLLEAVTGMQTLKAAQREGGSARSPVKTSATRQRLQRGKATQNRGVNLWKQAA